MPRGRSGGGNYVSNGRMQMGRGGGFTYNFGIAVASSAVRQMHLLAGGALELTAAFYALGRISSEYVDNIKQNTLAFGGQLKTMNAMIFAQKQLMSGATEFGGSDIMGGMRELMGAGIDAKKNFKFVSDAAQATGQSFTGMSGVISNAIHGNMQGMVQMGLMTQRATRNFMRFPADTVQRQAAIMGFLKNSKALQSAITQNFNTVAGQWRRIIEFVKMFAQSILGDPKNPGSLYARVRDLISSIANWMNKHSAGIRKAGAAIGAVLGWVVKQVGNFIKFVGRQLDRVIDYWDHHMGNFKQRLFSLLLWLELWKVHIVNFIKAHKEQLLDLLKVYLAFRAINRVIDYYKLFAETLGVVATRLKAVQRLMVQKGIFTDTVGVSHHRDMIGEIDARTAALQNERAALTGVSSLHRRRDIDLELAALQGERTRESSLMKSRRGLAGRGFRTRGNVLRSGEKIAVDAAKAEGPMMRMAKSAGGIMSGILGAAGGIIEMIPGWGWILGAAILIATQWDKIKGIIMPLVDQIMIIGKQLWGVIEPAVENLVIGFAKLIRAIGPILIPYLKVAAWVIGTTLKIVSNILTALIDIATWVSDHVIPVFQTIIDVVKGISEAFMNMIPQSVKDSVEWLADKFAVFSNMFESASTARDKMIANAYKKAGLTVPFSSSDVSANPTMANLPKTAGGFSGIGGGAFGSIGGTSYAAISKNFYKPDMTAISVKPGSDANQETAAPTNVMSKLKSFKNPLSTNTTPAPSFDTSDIGGNGVSIQSGAVQIIVQKGENIDEQKLASMIDKILPDLIRKSKLQQGK